MKKITLKPGLYIVATPIGNLEDISQRALSVLASVETIYCEDTRHSQQLLTKYHIQAQLSALHEHNESKKVDQLAEKIQQGQALALISDAGTPLISDPGYRTVYEIRQLELPIYTIPGPSSVMAALSISGLATDAFTFFGFLPHKSSAVSQKLKEYQENTETLVFFESPRRLLSTLKNIISIFGENRQMAVAREMTKVHEQVIQGTTTQVCQHFESTPDNCRGEIVIIIQGIEPTAKSSTFSLTAKQLMNELIKELPASKAASITAKLSGETKKTCYNYALD